MKSKTGLNNLISNRLDLRTRPLSDRKDHPINAIAHSMTVHDYLSGLNPANFKIGNNFGPLPGVCKTQFLSYFNMYENIVHRFYDLSCLMFGMYEIYSSKSVLYGDRFLAFVGNEMVRNYPWKDFAFTSEEAQLEISKFGNCSVTGLYDFEIANRQLKTIVGSLVFEHSTPISTFRNIYLHKQRLTVEDFFNLLVNQYRVVRVTVQEDNRLSSLGYRMTRPKEAYDEAGIRIFETTMWHAL